jgi:hypothetical protein
MKIDATFRGEYRALKAIDCRATALGYHWRFARVCSR